MKNKRIIWVSIIIVFIFLGVVIGAALVYAKLPLSPSMKLTIPTITPTSTGFPTPISNCGMTGAKVILVVVRDVAQWDPPHNADFIRYIKVDYSNKKVDVVSIPRDIWVQTPIMENGNYKVSRIGELYLYIEQNAKGSQKDIEILATTTLAQTLYNNFGITPNFYLSMDGSKLPQIIDLVGGIDIYNTTPFTVENHYFDSGNIHINGQEAELYMRWLPTNVESEDRLSRQEKIIIALWEKMLIPENFINIPTWMTQFSNSFITDLSPQGINSLICMTKELSKDEVNFHDISLETTPELVSAGPGNSLIPNISKMSDFLKEYLSP